MEDIYIKLRGCDYTHYEGMKVKKKSGKPFSNKEKIVTIKQIECHPYSGRLGFSFNEVEGIMEDKRLVYLTNDVKEIHKNDKEQIIHQYKLRKLEKRKYESAES